MTSGSVSRFTGRRVQNDATVCSTIRYNAAVIHMRDQLTALITPA